jgi:hypothetical protein
MLKLVEANSEVLGVLGMKQTVGHHFATMIDQLTSSYSMPIKLARWKKNSQDTSHQYMIFLLG